VHSFRGLTWNQQKHPTQGTLLAVISEKGSILIHKLKHLDTGYTSKGALFTITAVGAILIAHFLKDWFTSILIVYWYRVASCRWTISGPVWNNEILRVFGIGVNIHSYWLFYPTEFHVGNWLTAYGHLVVWLSALHISLSRSYTVTE
jgi:hypothetical protein